MTEIQNCTLQFDEKTVSSNFVFVQKYARLKEEALGLTVQCTYSRWLNGWEPKQARLLQWSFWSPNKKPLHLMVTDDDCMTTDCCLTITSLGMTRQSVTIGDEHGERESVFFSMHFSMHFSML